MSLDDQQIRALTFLACACRPNGARRWDSDGTFANIAKVRTRSLPEVVMAVIRAASDRDVESPGVIPSAGSHWQESAAVTTFVPKPFDRQGACSVCSQPESAPWHRGGDHEFESVEMAATRKGLIDIHRTVAALKDELVPTAPTPEPQTLAERLAAIPAEKRDPQLEAIRVELAQEPEAAESAAAEVSVRP